LDEKHKIKINFNKKMLASLNWVHTLPYPNFTLKLVNLEKEPNLIGSIINGKVLSTMGVTIVTTTHVVVVIKMCMRKVTLGDENKGNPSPITRIKAHQSLKLLVTMAMGGGRVLLSLFVVALLLFVTRRTIEDNKEKEG
jgi:RsiW-degrading membrane proteinase PrsW (M82 family)